MASSSSFALQLLAYVALGSAIRWMFTAGRDQQPKVFGNTRLYSVKWQVRLVCLASIIVFVAVLIGFRNELRGPDRWWASVFVVAMLMAVATAIGSVRTDETSITMKGLWSSRSFRWAEITKIQYNPKNGQLKLFAGPRKKLSVDFRFGVNTILNETIQRTGLQPATG
jgi:hypothetical protein